MLQIIGEVREKKLLSGGFEVVEERDSFRKLGVHCRVVVKGNGHQGKFPKYAALLGIAIAESS